MKKFAIILALLAISISLSAKTFKLTSPDQALEITVKVGKSTTYSINYKDTKIVDYSPIALMLADGRITGRDKVSFTKQRTVDRLIDVIVGKNDSLRETYNELEITFDRGAYALTFRAYNEGVAYRWTTALTDSITIADEQLEIRFVDEPEVWFPQCDSVSWDEKDKLGRSFSVHQGYRNFERLYRHYQALDSIHTDIFAVGPTLFRTSNGINVIVTESNVYDYPGLYIRKLDSLTARGHWAAYPRKWLDMDPDQENQWYSNHLVYEREDFIAHTEGTRQYPWRVIIATDDDKSLLNNELVYLLADECQIADTSWIRPGRSAWEWWHKAVVEGVDFPVGNRHLSEDLYKVYIDWAARNGIEYMTLDAGWSEKYLKRLCDYGRERGVGIIVWTWASCPLESPGDWIKRMKAMGVSGAKIDFFERNDQIAMTWQRELARRLADQQMVVIFHGCPVPSGLNRAYPNVLNYEAVRGAECNFWESTLTPRHHVTFPFIRSLAGPQDYTPGSMRSVRPDQFRPYDIDSMPPMSMGTRAHEMALFIVLDQWLATICDSPSEYDKYPEIVDYLAAVPSTWDETKPLAGAIGEYIALARRKGDDWFVGILTDEPRTIDISLDFLPANTNFEAIMLRDAPESRFNPKKCVVDTLSIASDTTLQLELAPGGGATVRLKRK